MEDPRRTHENVPPSYHFPLPVRLHGTPGGLRPLIGNKSQFLFPAVRNFKRPMTVNAALRRLGYAQNELTGHGFRSMASTILNENGWPVDAIKRQLVHVERNAIRATYNHAEYLDVRRDMMQWWADWLG